jgi:hypothetical protein
LPGLTELGWWLEQALVAQIAAIRLQSASGESLSYADSTDPQISGHFLYGPQASLSKSLIAGLEAVPAAMVLYKEGSPAKSRSRAQILLVEQLSDFIFGVIVKEAINAVDNRRIRLPKFAP